MEDNSQGKYFGNESLHAENLLEGFFLPQNTMPSVARDLRADSET
jgi:hypothetical protein